MLDKEYTFYQPIHYDLIGKLVKIKSPGMLITNESSPRKSTINTSDQIFDRGGKNVYLLVEVETWTPHSNKNECFIMAKFLFGEKIYTWRGIKVSHETVYDTLDSRIELV